MSYPRLKKLFSMGPFVRGRDVFVVDTEHGLANAFRLLRRQKQIAGVTMRHRLMRRRFERPGARRIREEAEARRRVVRHHNRQTVNDILWSRHRGF